MSTPENQPRRRFSAAETASEAQRLKLLELLRLRPHHTDELREKGIFHAAARVQDLEKRGYIITSGRISLVDRDGYPRRGIALYTLIGTPDEVQQ